jgi:uncharacterized membrane protein
LGWCAEVAYAAVNTGKFINRGFLNGAVCPIYGIGAVIGITVMTPLQNNIFILFFGAVLLASLLELFSGWILEKAFSQKWWDYSHLPFNIGGYICLKFSLIWGIACVLLVNVIHPIIERVVLIIDVRFGQLILVVLYTAVIIDIVASVLSVLNLNKQLKQINQFAVKMRNISDDIGERIFEESISIMEKTEAFKSEGYKRILKAFPNLKSKHFDQELKELRNRIFNKQ